MENNLYRIISLENFVTICALKKERYVNPVDCWEDTYEGLWLHKLNTEQGYKEVIDYLYNNLFNKKPEVTINNLAKMQRAKFACFGQSWSKEADSDAMWRIYSYDKKGIQIISDKDKIRKMIDNQGIEGLITTIRTVDYKLDLSNPNSIKNILYVGSKADEGYFHKRKAFEHEKEVRVILQLTKEYMNYTIFTADVMDRYFKKHKGEKTDVEVILDAVNFAMSKNLKGFYAAFPKDIKIVISGDLSEYLKGVKVHPQAPQWYVEIIRDLCGQYGLNFLGKSKLYSEI